MDAALIVIDQQIDFQPLGALAVAGGDEVVPSIAKWMYEFKTVVMTQDSHPAHHISFASSYVGKNSFEILTLADLKAGQIKSEYFTAKEIEAYLKKTPGQTQTLWPDHCVVGTKGWGFDPRLPLERADLILRKGVRRESDSYSAFFENDGRATGLSGFLKERGIGQVVVVGLAGDYCVAWSALDAQREGFQTHYVESLTRFVNFPAGSRESTLQQLAAAKVSLVD